MRSIALVCLLAAVAGCARTEEEAETAKTAPASAAATAAASTSPAAGYQAVEVGDGGSIAVTVLYSGEPKRVKAEVARDQTTCGTTTAIPVIEVRNTGQLKNAIVFIEDIHQGKAPDLRAMVRLDNEGCHFVPHVQAMTVGQNLEITNSDPILHNTHAYCGNRTVFNIALPIKDHRTPCKVTSPGLMNIKCDAGHGWMDAWIYAFPHPYHAVTGDQGRAVLADVPPGVHRITAWHEELGSQTAEVTVKPGETVELSLNQLVKPAAPAKAASS